MRFIDRVVSFVFDIIVIILALTCILVMTNVVRYPVVEGILKDYVFNYDYQAIIISVAVVVILLGLKITVFSSTLSSTAKRNILVDTPHGRIQIAQETIEGIARNVIKDYPEVKDVQARMTKARKGINMYMVLQVYQNTNIKDIVTKVQNDVKEQITATTAVNVQNVDVKIKNNLATPNTKPVQVLKVDKKVVEPEMPMANEIQEIPMEETSNSASNEGEE